MLLNIAKEPSPKLNLKFDTFEQLLEPFQIFFKVMFQISENQNESK
jgi:hypothetical protein